MAVTGRTLHLEQELRDAIARITDQHTRDLVRAWATAWDEIAPDLADTFTQMLTGTDAVTRAQLLRSVRLRKSLDATATSLEGLVADTEVMTTGRLREIIDAAGRAQATIIASQLPPATPEIVDLESWTRVDRRQISAIVERSTEQITALTRPLAPTAYAAVQRELIRGVASGSNPRETARRIVRRAEGAFNGGLTRALTIARTESLDAHRAAAALGQAPHTDVLTGWTWLATLGPRTCPACWGMNGTFHELDEPGPSGHQNCRCARIPTTKPWADLGLKVKEPPSALPDADAAFARLNPLQQQAVLGRTGYAAWVDGRFPRSQWAVRQKNPGWRDSFVPAKPPGPAKRGTSRATPPVAPRPKRSRPTSSGTGGTVPPPPAPATPPGPQVPPMGRTVGTIAEQQYVKGSTLGTAPRTPMLRATANTAHTFVPDPDDRTTAMLQYVKVFEDLVKDRARSLEAGEPFTKAQQSEMRKVMRQIDGHPWFGIDNGNYKLADLRNDVEGAAYRLLSWRSQEQDVGTVFKAITLNADYDLATNAGKKAALAAVQLDDLWFSSATPDRQLARGYLPGPDPGVTGVMLVIENATGIMLDSMGRMASTTEVLISGRIVIKSYDVINGVLRITGRWAR